MFATIQATAAPVGLRSAQIEAQQFVQQQLYGGRLLAPITGEMKLAHVEMNSKMLDRPVFYIFNTNNGHVVVSGDDRAEKILGYGDYPLDYKNIPCNMKALFAMLKEQIEYLQAHEEMQAQAPSLMAPARIPSVEPLLTALINLLLLGDWFLGIESLLSDGDDDVLWRFIISIAFLICFTFYPFPHMKIQSAKKNE